MVNPGARTYRAPRRHELEQAGVLVQGGVRGDFDFAALPSEQRRMGEVGLVDCQSTFHKATRPDCMP